MIRICEVHSLHCQTERIIRECLKSRHDGQLIFIAPESSKASVERIVTSQVSEDEHSALSSSDIRITSSWVDGDVVSFIRLAVRILDICGVSDGGSSDKIVLRNAIYRILVSHHNEFKTFGKFLGKFEYVDAITDLLGDFRRYGIGQDGISAAYESAFDDPSASVYADKLHDLKLLTMYMNEIDLEFNLKLMSDPISEASMLLKSLIDSPELLDSRRYRSLKALLGSTYAVIGFGNIRLLTPQEISFVHLLSELGCCFNFYPIMAEDDSYMDAAIYSNAGSFVRTLTEGCSDVVYEDLSLDDDSCSEVLKRASYDYALRVDRAEKDIISDSCITCSTLKTSDDVIGYVSNEIIRLTRRDGYRYKDIRIVCADDDLKDNLRGIMSTYGLDTFVDRKIIISNTPVFRFIIALAELPTRRFRFEDVLSLLRTGLAGVTNEDTDVFENYCIRYNITGERLFTREYFNSESKYTAKVFREGRTIPAGEYLWENVIERVLIPIRESATIIYNEKLLSAKAMKLAEYTNTLSSNIKFLAKEFTDRKDSERASALVRGYSEVMSLLVQFTTPMNEVPIDQETFVSLLKIDMRNKVQATIPLMVDSVEIVSPEQAYITPCKVMFLIGTTAENFPYSKVSEGIMNASELMRLSADSGVVLPDKVKARNTSDLITAALMFSAVEEKLYIARDMSSKESSVYTHFAKYSSSDSKTTYKMSSYGREVVKRHDFLNANIARRYMDEIMDDKMSVSVSSIETFNTCHMRYMLQYILGIKQREDSRAVKSNVMGTIIHHMFEVALKDIVTTHETPASLGEYAQELRQDEEILHEVAQKAFTSYCDSSENYYEKTPRFAVNPGRKAMRLFEYVLPIMLEEASSSNMVPYKFEMNLKHLSEPIRIMTQSGKEISFVGSIDRLDLNPDSGEVRVIDYKTGAKKIELKKTLAGLQTQLFAYANAAIREGCNVNDVGYFEIGMKPATKGEFKIEPQMSSLSNEDFEEVRTYVDMLIRQNCDEIAEGKADARVNSLTGNGSASACRYCPYSGACGNDPSCPERLYNATIIGHEDGSKAKTEDIINTMKARKENKDE
ncbi:MAG: PD-(D/E)XK nuclease family protein [Saccharofermentans sp.]|nr:PD-(D/E)XK nuclease family protein [Saccharofermentans sp.]